MVRFHKIQDNIRCIIISQTLRNKNKCPQLNYSIILSSLKIFNLYFLKLTHFLKIYTEISHLCKHKKENMIGKKWLKMVLEILCSQSLILLGHFNSVFDCVFLKLVMHHFLESAPWLFVGSFPKRLRPILQVLILVLPWPYQKWWVYKMFSTKIQFHGKALDNAWDSYFFLPQIVLFCWLEH